MLEIFVDEFHDHASQLSRYQGLPFGDPMAIDSYAIDREPLECFHLFLIKFGHFTHEDITALMHSRAHTQVNKNSKAR